MKTKIKFRGARAGLSAGDCQFRHLLACVTIFLVACGQQGGVNQKVAQSQPVQGPAVITPAPLPAPAAAPSPSPAPAPVPAPSPSPAPPPAALNCYVNNGVFCTGGNLGSNVAQLDINQMFVASDPRFSVFATGVQNGVVASYTALCAEPTQSGCYQNSVCVTVNVHQITGGSANFTDMLCGDVVTTANLLGDQ